MANRPATPPLVSAVSALEIHCDSDWILAVKSGYKSDTWCLCLLHSLWDTVAQKAIGDCSAGSTPLKAL